MVGSESRLQAHDQGVFAAAVGVGVVIAAAAAVAVAEAAVERLRGVVAGADFKEGEGRAQGFQRGLVQGAGDALAAGGGVDGKRKQGHFVQDQRAGDEAEWCVVGSGGKPDVVLRVGAANIAGGSEGLQGGQVGVTSAAKVAPRGAGRGVSRRHG